MNAASQLLREWIETGSEEAFSRLVAQHVDLVYSVALRKAGGASGLASDVTQQVFTDLARKAGSLRTEGSLAGWLHRHTCLTAATALRGEIRRRAREQTAAAMHALDNQPPDSDLKRLAPYLDDAVNALGETDRKAILLRFYQDRALREVGSELGLGEDAAQKRVARALEKLRDWLIARGVTSTTAVVTATLSVHSVSAAPSGLAATVSSGALSASAAAQGLGCTGLIELMTHTKAKIAVGTALAAAIVTPVVWQEQAIASIQTENRALAAQIALMPEPAQTIRQSPPLTAQATRDERAELERLRAEIPSLQRRIEEARDNRRMAAALSDLRPPAPQPFILARDARDVGAATPEDLIQSLFSAMLAANSQRVMELGDWSEEGGTDGLEKMVRVYDEMAADANRNSAAADRGFRVVREVPLGGGDLAIVIEIHQEGESDQIVNRIRRAGDQWRMVMGVNGPAEVKLAPELMRD